MNSSSSSADKTHTLHIDVSDAVVGGFPLHTVATVVLPCPSKLSERPVVVFALPGAVLNRQYFTFDMAGGSPDGQAGWHSRRGWIFVSIDSLGVGDASIPDADLLTIRHIAAANHHTATQILSRLAIGAVSDNFPPIRDPVVLGLGHSMGGGLTIAQQAYHDTFDAVGILGFSPVWTTSRTMPGARPAGIPFLARDAGQSSEGTLHQDPANTRLMELQSNCDRYPNKFVTPAGWNDYFDDVPADLIAINLQSGDARAPWRSVTMPPAVLRMLAPGSLGPEAASIVVPVLSVFGERDVSEDPRQEQKAYRHAVDFSSFICPLMGHMHNVASTREVLWTYVHHWGMHVAALKALMPTNWPEQLFSDSY